MRPAFKSQAGKMDVLNYYDSLLELSGVAHEKLYISTRWGKTFIIAMGPNDAPPLILLHGSAMCSVMWMHDARIYSRNYRVYAVDIPGEPGRSDEEQLPLAGAEYSDWLNDVLIALNVKQATLLGISLGAWLAAKYAVRYPDKVNRLILLSPAGIGPQKYSFIIMAVILNIFGEKGSDILYKKVNGNQVIPDPILKFQKLIEKNFNFRREMIPIFSDNELKQLIMPVALFAGAKDVMLHSAKTAKRLESLVPHAQINILPHAGHTLINLTNEINEFLMM